MAGGRGGGWGGEGVGVGSGEWGWGGGGRGVGGVLKPWFCKHFQNYTLIKPHINKRRRTHSPSLS